MAAIAGRTEARMFRVAGMVRFADGLPASRTVIAAFDRDLRSEQPLGEALTSTDGAYRIDYSETRILERERRTADLVVKALAPDGAMLATSVVLFNAPEEAAVDLTIPLDSQAAPTLFERLQSALEPLL